MNVCGGSYPVERVEFEERHETVYNFQVEDYHTYYVGENSVLVHNDGCGDEIYSGGRDEQELKELAEDPAHKGSTREIDIAKGEHEAKVGLELEERGMLSKIKRDPTGKAEFIDGNGQAWDVKSFNSNYPIKKEALY